MTPTTQLTYQGTTQSVTDWALDYGIPPATIIKRLNDCWPVGCAIGEPIAVEPGERLKDRLIITAIRRLTAAAPKPKLKQEPKQPLKPKKPVQKRRRPTGFYLTFNGKERSLNEWTQLTGIKHATLRYRLKQGWPVASILSEPVSKNSRNRPGVVSNFGASEGTGVGTSAQDTSKITFSKREAS
ncbi:hypothetical protein [Ruegeria meonggei]|uniref:hypothetical protein n=1 Tax=Ruegeria meonggei TaxID=1446476 RepID=UPI00366BCC0C